MNMFASVIFLALLYHDAAARDIVYCDQGTQLVLGENGGRDRCDPCPPGTFNNHKSHRENFCWKCSSVNVQDPLRELVANCTAHTDTVVRCKHREFYYSRNDKSCKQCSNCETQGKYLGLNCREYEDSTCCPRKDMIVREGECRSRTYCGVGEYFVPGEKGQHDYCMRCQLGKTNYASKHQRNSCSDLCFDTRGANEHRFTDRLFTCRSEECMVGRSCSRKNGLMCMRCLPNKATSSNDPHSETRNISENLLDEAEEINLHVFLLVVSAATVVTVAALVSVYIIVRRWQCKRLPVHDDSDVTMLLSSE